MNIELFLILSAAYNYALENEDNEQLRQYIAHGIESYMHNLDYMYDGDKKEWTDKTRLEDIARRRTESGRKTGGRYVAGRDKARNNEL